MKYEQLKNKIQKFPLIESLQHPEKIRRFKSIEILIRNQNRTSVHREYTTQEFKFLMKENGTKQGLLMDG